MAEAGGGGAGGRTPPPPDFGRIEGALLLAHPGFQTLRHPCIGTIISRDKLELKHILSYQIVSQEF